MQFYKYFLSNPLIALFLAIGLLSASVSAHAQASGQEQEKKEEQEPEEKGFPRFEEHVVVEASLEKIPDASTTWAKLPVPLLSTPASVGVVPRYVFESQESQVLGDAIKNVSGVNVSTGFGVFDYFVIRGFDSLETALVLTDGAFEPESTFYQLYNVERVEVLKGPAAFLYGPNPLSGTVNLVRKQPSFSNFSDVTFSYGSFQSYQAALDFNLARSDGRAAFRTNALLRGSEFYRDDKDNRLFAVNPSLTVVLNSETALTANFEYVSSDYQPDSGLPLVNNQLPDVPRTRSYQSPMDFSDQQIYRLRLDLESEIRPYFTLRNKFYFTDLSWLTDGTLLAGAFPSPSGSIDVFRSITLLDDRRRVVGNQLEALLSCSTGPIRHRFLAGFEASRFTDEFTLDVAALPTIDLYDPVETAAEPLFMIPGQSQAADARTFLFAPYVVDQLTFSEKVQLFVGGRFDALDYQDAITATSRDGNHFSPMLGAVFSPWPDLSFYANLGQAFSPPSSRVVGERKPEESRQVEIGTKLEWGNGRCHFNVALYRLERENIAIPDETGFTQQTGNQLSRGVEVELVTEILTDWLTLASYAFNVSELTAFAETVFTGANPPFVVLDRSGNTAPFAPKHIVNVWTKRELPNGLGLGGGFRYVSGQYIAPDNAYPIQGYLTLDATVSYRVKNWKWSLNFKNLTNREYETRGFGNSAVIPADPFTVYARVELSLGS
jgi:TonB-dependent siderophore receptor